MPAKRNALNEEPEAELTELEQIYVDRGLEPALARQVAEQLTAKDALSAHARDELGFSDNSVANPLQAAAASALAFSVGAALPTLVAILAPQEALIAAVAIATLIFLVALGGLGGWLGGASLNPAGLAGRILGRDGDGRNGRDWRGYWEGGLVGFVLVERTRSIELFFGKCPVLADLAPGSLFADRQLDLGFRSRNALCNHEARLRIPRRARALERSMPLPPPGDSCV